MNHHAPYHHPSPAAVTPSLPAGIDAESVRSRQVAMIEAGTHAMIAEKLAVAATQNQYERDHHPKFAAIEPTAEPTA